MCDQTEVSYLEDDVVWVKIGPIWWPGVVKDLEKDEEGREILSSLKKKPIAAVKFFQEDNYEFVKNLDHIYHYNCRKKDEFIKKGLDKYRTGASHMKKFPIDVTTAETLVNGDVNIVNDPKFFPEKKQNYSEIFGSGKKKTKKETETHPRSKSQPQSSNSTPYRPITHQRFINKVLHGESDHKVRTLIQPSSSPEDNSKGIYKCHVCKFETTRVSVIVAHHRLAHSSKNSVNWTGSDVKSVKRKPTYKARKTKVKKLPEVSKLDSSDDETLEKNKSKTGEEKSPILRRNTTSTLRKRKSNEAEDSQKRPRYTDVLLADWDEEDEEEKKTVEEKNIEESQIAESPSEVKGEAEEKGKEEQKIENKKMSCFDFDEEEDGFIGMSNANTYGRKIPRVIPLKDKSDLGADLDIGDIFKRKSESETDVSEGLEDSSKIAEANEDETETNIQEAKVTEIKVDDDDDGCENNNNDNGDDGNDRGGVDDIEEVNEKDKDNTMKVVKRRRKSSKDQETKVTEDSLAVRRTRRPGAKKSYLNEVIEKVEDMPTTLEEGGNEAKDVEETQKKNCIPSSSSRRKQDLKLQTMENNSEETEYHETSNEGETSSQKKQRGKAERDKVEDLTQKIDDLLAETNVPDIPVAPESIVDNAGKKMEVSKSLSTLNFSFDYVPPEAGKPEMKPLTTRMSSETIKGSESEEGKAAAIDSPGEFVDNPVAEDVRGAFPPGDAPSFMAAENDEGITLENNNSGTLESRQEATGPSENTTHVTKTKNIKTLTLKADALPSGLLSPTGKLKGQTIIHQKGGTYVILSQPSQIPRQKIATAKGQSSGKLVIVTNQHGEQKIITTSGLQQSKFKIEPQKVVVAASNAGDVSTIGKAQSVIKMVPDGKGGVMKQLTVSPKKVLLGGTKVLVSGAGAAFSTQGTTKIALTGGNNLTGDYRLIENYKVSGKTVLIQGAGNTSGGVLLKTGGGMQRGDTVHGTPNILNVKQKPKILMRATPQREYLIQSDLDSPTYVMKRKSPDGKFAAQKIIRRPVMNAAKAKTGTGSFLLSEQNESLILKTNHEPTGNKFLRLTPKAEVKPKFTTQLIQKGQGNLETSEVIETEEQEMKSDVIASGQTHPILQTQVMAMPGPIGSDGNQTYVLVSVDEHGVVQPVDNSLITYDTTGQTEVFMNPGSNNNVIVINPPTTEEMKPVFSNGSQDILAEALANTNVLEGNLSNDMETVMPSILLPPSIPSSVVQETSITLQKPIMTPLEMPTSVAPDTSGLEPPPLPPTPTEEDVLMEEQDMPPTEEQLIRLDDAKESKGDEMADSEAHSDRVSNIVKTQQPPQEVYTIENSQDQASGPLQSMPLLNDEPDTSDYAQGSGPIPDQDFEAQKSRGETQDLSSLLREQEPPSSTNNEVAAEAVREAFQLVADGPLVGDVENHKSQGDTKVIESKEMHSMPVITDDANINSYTFGQVCGGAMSQKRFQEETEVTSTTDEFSNKESSTV